MYFGALHVFLFSKRALSRIYRGWAMHPLKSWFTHQYLKRRGNGWRRSFLTNCVSASSKKYIYKLMATRRPERDVFSFCSRSKEKFKIQSGFVSLGVTYNLIMIFGEVLIFAFLATTMGLLGVSIHSMFSKRRTSIIELRKLEDKMMEKYGWAPSVPYNPYYPPDC